MARAVKIKEIKELGLSEPNLYHVQESYLRQLAQSHPKTARKNAVSFMCELPITSALNYAPSFIRSRCTHRDRVHLDNAPVRLAAERPNANSHG